jgi:hypothetical protein
MNTKAIFTRFEIFMYSTLTSAMSGINHFRSKVQDGSSIAATPSANADFGQTLLADELKKGPFALTWETVKTVLPALFLWIVLGFAAGFLIGMLKPR